jgi:5,10-methylenetetrahydrofolate reductase
MQKEIEKEKMFKDRLLSGKFPVTVEVPTVMGTEISWIMGDMERTELHKKADALNVPNNSRGRVRIEPLALSSILQQRFGTETMPHLTCRGETLSIIQRWLFGASVLNVKNVLVVSGDPPSKEIYPEEERRMNISSLEVIAGIKKYLEKGYLIPPEPSRNSDGDKEEKMIKTEGRVEMNVGAVFLSFRPEETRYLRKKMEAGADFFHSQITFDGRDVISFL